jgi:cation diffusion facilitator CzcD-associated flavoprotein CzcO
MRDLLGDGRVPATIHGQDLHGSQRNTQMKYMTDKGVTLASTTPTEVMSPGIAAGLAALEARLAWELAALQLPAARWTPTLQHEGQSVADVVIIGGGMSGLTLGAALQHRGMQVDIYDEAPAGFEGPWATTARMETLRSPKQLTGPALGIPSLSFRAWFEAQWGTATWESMDKIPRLQWMDYLRWYRRVLGIEVHNRHRVTDVWPQPDGRVKLRIEDPQGVAQERWARRMVLATGRAGLGGAWVPEWARQLPSTHWAHSSDHNDYAALKGLRVGVVGAGASAMDSAATALEAGAARVHLLVRRPDIPRINKGKGAGNPGFVHGHGRLPDAWKWRVRHYINVQQVPPPRGSTLRVSQHANAFFHLDCAVQGAQQQGAALQVNTSAGPIELDFLVFATGFVVDWAQRPMLRHMAPHARTWGDRWQVEPGQEDAELQACPDLGSHFEFQPKDGHACPGLDRIHCFNYPAALSLGVITGDIPAISEGALRLATTLAGLLWAEDIDYHFERMQEFAEPEVFGDEWVASPLPR